VEEELALARKLAEEKYATLDWNFRAKKGAMRRWVKL